MNAKRKIKIFSVGCSVCQKTIDMVNQMACPSCKIEILDMNDNKVAEQAKAYGVNSVPAVVVDGKLADCCAGKGPSEQTLRSVGVGQSLG